MRNGLAAGIGALCLAVAAGAAPGVAWAADQAIQLRGEGVQIYTCEPAGTGFAWTFKAPEARLLNPAGKEVGRHFAGPSWRAMDGSTVVGEALVTSPAPAARAVPWLVLRAKSHEGSGTFADVAYVARTETVGGIAPAAGCNAAHAHAEVRVPYSATYIFFEQPGGTG